jgi:cell division septum initiation protein DivIVA
MSTDPARLQSTLDELHSQLADVDSLDEQSRQRLATALREIQAVLSNKSKANESLVPRLREAARHFEGSHPALATTIGGLIDTLARAGI